MGYRESELELELSDRLKVCCGATSDSLDLIRKTLSIMKRRSVAIRDKNDAEHDQTYREQDVLLGYHANVGLCYIFLHFLSDLDLIEHGAGARCSWPTKEGLEVLTKLEAWRAEQDLKLDGPK